MTSDGTSPAQELQQLLASVAEQLKVPLAVISRHAELVHLTGANNSVNATTIATQADSALKLVDSYLLGLELFNNQATLQLEPVSISSLTVDIAHELHGFANQYGVRIELQTSGRFGPVISNQRGLRAALLSLGFALIESQAATDVHRIHHEITLATHRTPHGIVTGLYGLSRDITAQSWRRALEQYGRTRQPFTELSPSSGAGLFIADTIFRCMDTSLRIGHYQQKSGLVATLQPSQQLQLI